MNTAIKIVLLAMAGASTALASVSLSNVSIAQREGSKLVDIYFDADNTTASSVSVSLVISNGITPLAAISFSGNIGGSVSVGTGLHIEWDGGADLDGILTSNLTVSLQVAEPYASGLVKIPAGSNDGSDSTGSYSLTVDSFLMDATEITKSLWDLHAGGLTGLGKQANHPVQSVTWLEAVEWCNQRSQAEGLTLAYTPVTWARVFGATGYRLPTQEEWEYAARGGLSSELYPWGSTIDHSYANYQSTESEFDYHPDFNTGGLPYTSPVGYFDPNRYGLYDMAGNVYEWCDDRLSAVSRIRKGGSWDSWEVSQRCGNSEIKANTFESPLTGFRTVRDFALGAVQSQTITFDSRSYTLAVSSVYGSPIPEEGSNAFPWKSSVICTVDAAVMDDGTNYTCIGWTGTGSVPVSGSSNTVVVVLSNLNSSIAWNWASDDTDLDGMNDDWERDFFGNLLQDENSDHDLDGQRDIEEYIAGTDPTNKTSRFELSATYDAGSLIIEWPTASNRIYNVNWTDNLLYIPFTNLESNIAFPRNSFTTTPVQTKGYFKADVRK